MTDEQKQKYKESEKRYRENMTDEQKQKQRDYQKEYRKSITYEQKQRYIKAIKNHQKKYRESQSELDDSIGLVEKILFVEFGSKCAR